MSRELSSKRLKIGNVLFSQPSALLTGDICELAHTGSDFVYRYLLASIYRVALARGRGVDWFYLSGKPIPEKGTYSLYGKVTVFAAHC